MISAQSERGSPARFWPYGNFAALVAIPVILGALSLLILTLATPESETVLLTGALILSVIPLALAVLDLLIERGGGVEAAGIKLNFAQVINPPLAALPMPANLGGAPG